MLLVSWSCHLAASVKWCITLLFCVQVKSHKCYLHTTRFCPLAFRPWTFCPLDVAPPQQKIVSWRNVSSSLRGVYSDTTQLNSTDPTQLTQLNSVQPSQSYFCLWRHDLQIESTGSPRSLIGDSWVELCRYRHIANSTQLDVLSIFKMADLRYFGF